MNATVSTPVRYTAFVMPRRSKLKLMSLPASDETPGERLARIRRERGFTRIEPAGKTGLMQAPVSDYERGKPRLNAESKKPSRKVLRRLELIGALPPTQQTALLRHFDTFPDGLAAGRRTRRA